MRPSLEKWIRDTEAARHLEHFQVDQASIDLEHVRARQDDYYTALVGELFSRMREEDPDPEEWERLGNAFYEFIEGELTFSPEEIGIRHDEVALFSAAAFYYGGYPASAYLAVSGQETTHDDVTDICYDFLARRVPPESELGRILYESLEEGSLGTIEESVRGAEQWAEEALQRGPEDWIEARLLHQLLERFKDTNVRAVLPNGESDVWKPLVSSFLDRSYPIWEFFPSQIQAIQAGLLEHSETFSLQMPTGSGKTALSEVLLYQHFIKREGHAAVLLVPYRSLAAELRNTLVRRLNEMGVRAMCVYGGSVPKQFEAEGPEEIEVVVATPESLSGLLNTAPDFLERVSLAICDEGHLLDTEERGVSLELLLTRLRERASPDIRFAFLSAIVPNIEEVNAWLGGSDETVVRSSYRPAVAEFAALSSSGSGTSTRADLVVHAHRSEEVRYSIHDFLTQEDFAWVKPETGRENTWDFTSYKTQSVAAARKLLPMGPTAIFSANKLGTQGVVGLAEELLGQIERSLPLPEPVEYAESAALQEAVEYYELEYGLEWIGTRALKAGVALHHGDIPQESREVIETMLHDEIIRVAICTNTLAEGVNLPLRSLVLYSVERRGQEGRSQALLRRDIKNLVGRAGRAGASTKGLVLCVNPNQWRRHVVQVARDRQVEPLQGGLRKLLESLREELAVGAVSNERLEARPDSYELIDGIDTLLVDLIAEEVGEEDLVEIARRIADETFAATQSDELSRILLREVFQLRAQRIREVHEAGRTGWIRETGARPRLLDSVEEDLLPRRESWDDIDDPTDPALIETLLEWAWDNQKFASSVRRVFRLDENERAREKEELVKQITTQWLDGWRFVKIADETDTEMNSLLAFHSYSLSYVLQTMIEQGIPLLSKLLEEQDRVLAPAARDLPDHLRFGVPDSISRNLMATGLRHRTAAVELASVLDAGDRRLDSLLQIVRETLESDLEQWEERLGSLVLRHTLEDVAP